MLPIRSLSCSPTASPRLRPRRSLSACEHYAVPRTCQSSELCHYERCSCRGGSDPERFTRNPTIRESHIYENSCVNLENFSIVNDLRGNVDSVETKTDPGKSGRSGSKGNMNAFAAVKENEKTSDRVKTEQSETTKPTISENLSPVETENHSSSSDDTLVDEDSSTPEYSSRDSIIDPSVSSESTVKRSEPNKKSCQKQSVRLDKTSDSKSNSPTFLRNSKIDGCQSLTDSYRKNLLPRSSSLLRQSCNSQNMIDLNRTDAELTKSPQLAIRNSRIVSLKSSVDQSTHDASTPSSPCTRQPKTNISYAVENKNLYQTFTNQCVNSPGSHRHVRINPADLLEYNKRDSRPSSRNDNRNIYKESPVCYRKSKDNTHADQINELNRRMTKSHYYSPSTSRNLSMERNSLVQLSDGKVYKSRPASLYPEFSSLPTEPIYANGMSPNNTPFIRRHSSMRAPSPASPAMNARRSAFVKYPTFGYFLPAMNYYQDVMGYYAPVANTQWEAELNCHSLSDSPPSSPPPPLPVPNVTQEEMFEEPVEEPQMSHVGVMP
ncbi:hypothetical protein M8J77_015515 [Diaphorina citri]|nr:hypothetical protein M8J77_015515 [Diaphorina citri]